MRKYPYHDYHYLPFLQRLAGGVALPLNGKLRAACVPGRTEGNPLVLIAHADTPAARLLDQARLLARRRLPDTGPDLEWDPE